MKKIILLCLVALLAVRGMAQESGTCGENLSWTLEDGVLTISGSGEMEDYYTSYSAPWYNLKDNIRTIMLQSGVTTIGDHAFDDCRSLTNVTIPSSVNSIGRYAFQSCHSLINITIPSSVNPIREGVFMNCSNLVSITIPNSVTSIGSGAFRSCSNLTSIAIPNGVTHIGSCAFYDCSNLTNITIPNSVNSIENNTFAFCSRLTDITIPNSITSIESSTFVGCSSLTNITMPNSVISIGSGAFSQCSSLTNITIPNSVTSIERYAFNNCSSLANVIIPSSVTSIERQAFGYCRSLTNIIIPYGVTSIESSTFVGCSSLTSVTIPSNVTSIGSLAFYECRSLTNITIPSGVTSISNSVFYNCSGLTNITIPSSVTSIENFAFGGCSSLSEIYCNASIPISIGSVFDGVDYTNCKLYVPKGSVEAYRAAAGWKDFVNILEFDAGENIVKYCFLAENGLSSEEAYVVNNPIAGKPYTAYYGIDGKFNSDNKIEIQLSNAQGYFDNPVVIGSINSTANNGTVLVTIPENTVYGTAYRIRVVSTSPQSIGVDNEEDLTITNDNTESNSITCSIGLDILKPGEPYFVTYSAIGDFDSSNRFYVQLFDPNTSGSELEVSEERAIAKSGQIAIKIPETIKPGRKYRLRVLSTSPQVVGADNGKDLSIGSQEELKQYQLTDNLTLYYENWETISTTKFKASGGVNINNILYFDCPIEIERIDQRRAFISGLGGIFILDIKGESFQLKDGEFKYRADNEKLELIYTQLMSFETLFKLAGMNASYGDMEFDKTANDWVRIAYSFYNPGFPFKQIVEHDYAKYKEWARSNDMLLIPQAEYLSPRLEGAAYYSKSNGVAYSFDVSLKNLDFKFFKLDELAAKYDPIKKEYSGKVKLGINVSENLTTQFLSSSQFAMAPVVFMDENGTSFRTITMAEYIAEASAITKSPSLALEFEFSYKNGLFKLMVSAGNLKIPIPNTPVMITKMASNFEYQDKGAVDYFGFGATVDIAPIGDDVAMGLMSAIIEGKDIGFQLNNPPFSLMISGKLNLFKTEVANAKLGWDGKKNTFLLNGEMDILDIIVGGLNLNIYSAGCNGTLYGYVHVPSTLTKYDFLSSLSNWKFNGTTVNWYNRSFDFELQAFWDKISCAGVYVHGSGYDWYWGKNLKDLGIAPRSSFQTRAMSSDITFYLSETNTPKLYVMFWGNGSLVDFSVISPSGKMYNKSNALYQELPENQQTVMAVENPESGEWTIMPSSDYENFKVYSLDMAPTIMFDKPMREETTTDIRLLLNDFEDNLTVTFFYDDDKKDFDGLPIIELTNINDAILDYNWNTDGLPSGDYYIYCRVSDGKNTPIMLYAPGVISVNNHSEFTEVPQNIRYEQQDNDIIVSWDRSNDQRINYATVYYKNNKTEQILGRVSDVDSVKLDDLTPGVRYQIWATYTDTTDVESNISNIVEFTYKAAGNNPPRIISNDDYWTFREGQQTKMELEAYDVDGNALSFRVLENISNYQLSANSFIWTPSAKDLLLKELRLVVSDGLQQDTLQQKIRFIDIESQDISVSFAAPILYDANYHFVKIQNPLLTRSKFENIQIQNKRTGYKIILPCDKVSDDLFMGKLVLTKDEYSFIPVQSGDTIQLSYQYAGSEYIDYAVYSPVETRAFRLGSSEVAVLNGWQYSIEQEDKMQIDKQSFVLYPNPNQGEFDIQVDGLENASVGLVSIYDLQGKLIYSMQEICLDKSGFYRKIKISNIPSGVYFLDLVVKDTEGCEIFSGNQKFFIR